MSIRLEQLLYIKNHESGTLCVYEDEKKDFILCNLNKFLEGLCLEHGSSLEGRAQSFRYLTGFVQKPCILVDEKREVLLFPVLGLMSYENYFINYQKVVYTKCIDTHESELVFCDGTRLLIPFDIRVIRNQIKRCELYIQSLIEHS